MRGGEKMAAGSGAILREADRWAKMMEDAEKHIWAHPETGFREWQTQRYLKGLFAELGYEKIVEASDVPGFYVDVETGRPGPKLLIMFELDALLNPQHPEAVEGAVHACGHHAQCAAGVGIAAMLRDPAMTEGLSGSIRLMAVPAEELIELEYREELASQGKIRFFGGKPELMSRGMMDGVDLAFLVHTTVNDETDFRFSRGHNGCVTKTITYTGRAAHAGGSPHRGINALYAAHVGIAAVNALRETFVDEDHIRVHPIITQGGESVNIIPDRAVISTYVRGATDAAIRSVNRSITRAFAAGAVALGAEMHISERYGYSPLVNDRRLNSAVADAVIDLFGEDAVDCGDSWSRGSTDVGMLCEVMPTIQFTASGACGTAHGADYRIADVRRACVNSAAAQVAAAIRLLSNDAAIARSIVSSFVPKYKSQKDYLSSIDAMTFSGKVVSIGEDGSVSVDLPLEVCGDGQ